MTDLITWLRAQLDEDGQLAQAALDEAASAAPRDLPGMDDEGRLVIGGRVVNVWATSHLGRWSPRRVLAEVEAKRRILDWYETVSGSRAIHVDAFTVTTEIIKLLALPYADRPGFRGEWR